MGKMYPKPKAKKMKHFAEGGLMEEDGNPPGKYFKELRTADGWKKKRDEEAQDKADYEARGTSGRSVGEHALALARGVFEGTKYRDAVSKDRDPVDPRYDRRKGKVN